MGDFLTVVIPAYNEETRIRSTLEKVHSYCSGRFPRFEIIVVDDGSSDDTSELIKFLSRQRENISLIRYPENAGKGYAVKRGVLSSSGDLLLICDADLSTPIEELERLLPFVRDEYDIAIGSRGLRDSRILERQPWYRQGMGKTFNLFVQMFALGGIRDTQCGFKLFKGDIARDLFNKCRINGFSFDVEVLYLARKASYKIREVPITWINSPFSRVVIMRDPLKMLLELFKIRANSLTGKYN